VIENPSDKSYNQYPKKSRNFFLANDKKYDELGTTFILKTTRRQRKRLRKEQDDTRLGFEVDYDRIIFSAAFRSLQDKTQVIPFLKPILFIHD
jgi:hypothetical protein